MKLQIMSDTHLEFSNFVPDYTDASTIILAGDIGSGLNGLYWAKDTFPNKHIIYIIGNHEHYGFDRQVTLNQMKTIAKSFGIHFLENDEVIIDGVRFLGCTLWTDFKLFGYDQEPYALQAGQRGLNDFRLIREDDKIFTAKRSQELHEESIKFLKMKLNESFDGKTVVVTHHTPSMLSVHDRYKNDLLSACFSSNLDDMFGKMDLWVHGHTHVNLDYISEGTRVICNPRGYVTAYRNENKEFNPGLIVEI